jgi:beta-lactamase class A
LLECPDTGTDIVEDLEALHKKIEDLIGDAISRKQISEASVYFRDLDNASWFGVGEDKIYVPASLLKVPTMISFLKVAQLDPGLLEQVVRLDKFYDLGTHLVEREPSLELGGEYAVRELIETMVRDSDNDSIALLFDKVVTSASDLHQVFADLGVPYSEQSTGPITAKQYSSFFRILYNASYLDQADSEYVLKLLTETNFNRALVAGVPVGVRVAHKFGERWLDPKDDKYFHDCGIIYYPSRPYLLCVMTKGQDFETLVTLIKDISSTVYYEVDLNRRAGG